MSRMLAANDPALSAGWDAQAPPSASVRGAKMAGWIILLLFFGGIGGWSVTAPLNGAVIGKAVAKVEGNRKSVQHLDGGVIKELRVREGDRVEVGTVLVVLDDSQILADYDVLLRQDAMLRATEARLLAELRGDQAIDFPRELLERTEPYARTAIEGQVKEFATRSAALAGLEQVLNQRKAQLRQQMAGNQAQADFFRAELNSALEEEQSLAGLVKRGLVTRTRMLDLNRMTNELRGKIADAEAKVATAEEALGEYDNQIDQHEKDRMADITHDLRETQLKLLEVGPRLRSTSVSLGRTEIRSPYAGQVVDLNVFSVGGVIGGGQRILDVVPDQTPLVFEAQIAVEDISDIHPGMAAVIHFTSYKQRTIPLIHGKVSRISADRLVEERTGVPYYLAYVDIDLDELAASPQIKLYPGMPATVLITTQERTPLDYLIGPFVISFDRAFRER